MTRNSFVVEVTFKYGLILSFPSQNDNFFFQLAGCIQKTDLGDDKPTYF